jgi:hypothetical protein
MACVLHCLLILEQYGEVLEYLPGKMKKNVVADTLSLIDIDRPMHTALIFKKQAIVKEHGL